MTGGGGGGGTAIYYVSGLSASQSITVTIGGAGSGGSAGANGGNAGGSSSIVVGSTTVTANGGVGGGTYAGEISNPAPGGTASNGTMNLQGGPGGWGDTMANCPAPTCTGSTMIQLNSGDKVQLQSFQNSGGSGTVNSGSIWTWIAITKF